MANILVSTENLSHEKWLNYRNLGLGGSDASVVCGINKYKSPVELWLEKTGQLPSQEVGEPAYWGNRLENLVKEEFTVRTGIEIIPIKQILQSQKYPFMLANLDGMCEHPDYGQVIFEAKTASSYKSSDWDNDKIPDEYMLQLQHYIAVTGLKGAYISVLIGGNKFKWKFVNRDEDLISMLIHLEQEFWEHVQSKTPPNLDSSEASAEFINNHFSSSIPQTKIQLPQSARKLINQYNLANDEINKFKEQKQESETLLKQMLGENEAGTIGNILITWKTVAQERLDTKTLKVEHPTLFKKYSNKTSYRKFSVKLN